MTWTTPRKSGKADPSHGVSARRRVVTSAAVGALAGPLSALALPWYQTPLVAWDVAAATYLCWIWAVLWKLDARRTAQHAEREDPTRAAADLMVLGAAFASLVAVAVLIVRAGPGGSLAVLVQVAFGVTSVVLSWAVIHTVFALRYAWLFYQDEDGGIDFHQPHKPQYSDFAYFAFTVGMTYQVSDTEVNTAPIRATVLRHSLLSYLFGTLIVALTINLVAGLGK